MSIICSSLFIIEKLAYEKSVKGQVMKIHFENQQLNQISGNQNTSYSEKAEKGKAEVGYQLNLYAKQNEMAAYGKGKTKEDIETEMAARDVELTRKMLTVMSSTMSKDALQKMVTEGHDIVSMNPEETVTIIDHIKAALLKGGSQIEGYNSDMQAAELEEVTGSISYAKKLLSQLNPIDDQTKKYMIQNKIVPTIEGIYQAQNSSGIVNEPSAKGYFANDISGYYAKKADQIQWDHLETQIESTIKEAGYFVDDKSIEEGKWLIEKGLPITADTLNQIHTLNQIQLPLLEEEENQLIFDSLLEGKNPLQKDISEKRTIYERAKECQEIIEHTTEEALSYFISEKQTITINGLKEAAIKNVKASEDVSNKELVHAKRILAETQLFMTTKANLKLLESGYAIETAPLEGLVEALREAEESILRETWQEEDVDVCRKKQTLYENTIQIAKEIPSYPIEMLGKFVQSKDAISFSLNSIEREGKETLQHYEKAQKTYETYMTAPRKDLGDNILKAFKNIDTILEELSVEATELNRRAVKILGYNEMEITKESIKKVAEKDLDLQRLIHNMKPAKVLQAIRDHVNPLEMTIDELNEYFISQDSSISHKIEKIEKFLFRLEKNNEITPEEKESCIGIYRLLYQLENTDHKALGDTIKNGKDISFENLISSMRSMAKRGMDYTVDDSFLGVEARFLTPSITDQIQMAFREQMENPQYIKALLNAMEQKTLEYTEKEKEQYVQETQQDAEKLIQVDSQVLNILTQQDLPISVDYLVAANQYMNQPPEWLRKLSNNVISQKIEELLEDWENGEDSQSSYINFTNELEKECQKKVLLAEKYLDIRALKSGIKQLSVMTKKAANREYELPMILGGECTTLHIKLEQRNNDASQVKIAFENSKYGKVAAFFKTGIQNTGYMMCSQKTDNNMNKELNMLENTISGNIDFFVNPQLDLVKFINDEIEINKSVQYSDINKETGNNYSNKQLLSMAVSFIRIFQED